MLRIGAGFAIGIAALVVSGNALAAQLIDRNATGIVLEVGTKGGGEAMIVYHAGGKLKHVLVWGATNARPPTKFATQEKFKVDYAGGWGKYHTLYWKHFVNQCQKYDGPALPNVVTECKSPDGTYWAIQQWPQALPDLGFSPFTAAQKALWMEISHWTGPVASLTVNSDWVYSGRYQELFGTYMYAGQPVYGFGTTSVGAPTDNYGRLIYLDTFNSVYGPGWRRENSFVPHNPTGVWCYGFYSFDPTKGGYVHPPGQTAMRGPGIGEKYRLIAAGPGVTPNVEADIGGFHAFDANNPNDVSYQQEQTALLKSLGDKSCLAGHHS
jgi:hypothetical protein